jgi:protein TonB
VTRRPSKPARHYLWLGIAFSLLAHGIILSVRAAYTPPPRTLPDVLEVAIVNARTEAPPDRPQIKAQTQIDGGGTADKGVAASPLPRTGAAPDTIVLQALQKRQGELEQEQRNLLTLLSADAKVTAPPKSPGPTADATADGQDETDQPAVVSNAQVAVLAQRVQAYNQRPRKQFVAPQAVSAVEAAYVEGWRAKIESTGTRFYPDEARGKVYGSLRMTVSIKADGSIAGVEIDQPSTEPILNQAARRIVQLAAPFPPFPPELARSTDVLAITRTWHFVNDTLNTAAP